MTGKKNPAFEVRVEINIVRSVCYSRLRSRLTEARVGFYLAKRGRSDDGLVTVCCQAQLGSCCTHERESNGGAARSVTGHSE